jgi:predicted dehydrogenase
VAVTALWNRTRSRAEELADTLDWPNVEIYDDWRDLIERGQVDIVSIATAPTVRLEPFAAALAQQRHVLVEKPLSLGLPEAQEMASLARQAQTVTAISLNWRYSPACQTTWRAMRDGQVGRLLDTRTEWRGRTSLGSRPWSTGGALREAGSHEFDRIRFLTGWRFKRVVCSLTGAHAEGSIPSDTAAFVTAEMSDQRLGSLRLSMTPGEPDRRITVSGEEGTITMSADWVALRQGDATMTLSNEVRVFRQRADDADPVSLEIAESDRQPPDILSGQHTWNRLIADFVTAVRRGDVQHQSVPHLPHVSDGLAAQEVIAACELSHAERRWVDL